MDQEDLEYIMDRAALVSYLMSWAEPLMEPDLIEAILDAIPEMGSSYLSGRVVAWAPFDEDGYEVRWCRTNIGFHWNLWRASRSRSLMSFVLDLKLAKRESEYMPIWDEEDDDSPYDWVGDEDELEAD